MQARTAMSSATPKVILITGGTRGIGAATARTLQAAGHRVFVTSRKAETPPPATGITVLPLDVGDPASVAACTASAIAQAGRLDVLVNNAGYDLYAAVEETSDAEFAAQMDTNLNGAVRMTRAVLPQFRAQGSGRIVMIGSIGGRLALPLNAAYGASKFALEGFSEALWHELRPLGLHVTIIAPGAVRTDTLHSSIVGPAVAVEPYATRRSAMVAQMLRDGAASRLTPDHVARAVLRAVTLSRPPLRMAVGAQATWVPRLKTILPERAYAAMIDRLFP
jgi:NAD(P)-dependent dehydrogenase (short-subunit alcohol dehydrogenase family)